MAKVLSFPTVSLKDPAGKRVRISCLRPGAALLPKPEPVPILGYRYRQGHLSVYVNGPMPLVMRSAQEEGCLDEEAWLVDHLPTSIQEIDLTDCRDAFRLLKAA